MRPRAHRPSSAWPGIQYPRVPRREIAGVIGALGAGVRPMIEDYPLERTAEAYDRMMSGGARFRVVPKMA